MFNMKLLRRLAQCNSSVYSEKETKRRDGRFEMLQCFAQIQDSLLCLFHWYNTNIF
jgi:hypothetical protein